MYIITCVYTVALHAAAAAAAAVEENACATNVV